MDAGELEILKEFQTESMKLLVQMKPVLELCEGDLSQALRLEDYGNFVDRIMGGAKNMALAISNPDHVIHQVALYSNVLKVVSYKTAQIRDNDAFYDVCSAFLIDANEVLDEMIRRLLVFSHDSTKAQINQRIIERLQWISSKFSAEYRASVDTSKGRMKQNEIDELLKKLGVV
jgi:hypothetical protein